jgi:Flp pilus assembly protein TadD
MVHRPAKTPSLAAVLLFSASIPFFAVQTTHAQEPPPAAPAQFDPSDVYFQGYLATRAAEKLEADGDFIGAAEKLNQASKFFESVRRYYPDWKKEMVAGRAEKTTEAITKVRPKAEEQRKKNEGAVAELEGGTRVGAMPAPPTDPNPGVLASDPLLTRRLTESLQEVQRLRNQIANSAPTEATRNASRVADVERQRDSLAAQLRAAETNVESLRARLTTSPAENEFKALNKRIEGLEMEREAMARALTQSRGAHSAALEKIANLQADVTNLRSEAAKLKQQQVDSERNLTKERSVANEVVAGLRRQLDSMEKSLKAKGDELDMANQRIAGLQVELEQSRAAFTELRTERDGLLLERDQMAALLKLNEAGRIQQLIEQNMGLAKQLREATEKVDRLDLDNNATKDELTETLRDLAMAKEQINAFRKERIKQEKRLEELQARLKNEEGALARGEVAADPAEVEVLRDIIKRQIRAQNHRNEARNILVEAAKKLGSQDQNVAQAIEMFEGEEIQLTPEEQKLIADRRVDGEFISPFARDRATVEGATQGLKRELESYDRAATRAFAAERYHPAKELFQMIVDANPGDTSALCKLGVIQLKLNDLPGADNAFRRAIELDESNPYAHMMLGLTLHSAGNSAEAEERVARSVELAPDSYKAQMLLGFIQFEQGKTSQAETHFKAAISADPVLSDPYINLALISVKKKKLDDARTYYQQGLERGALPDPRLEKLLASSAP